MNKPLTGGPAEGLPLGPGGQAVDSRDFLGWEVCVCVCGYVYVYIYIYIYSYTCLHS